jgi:DNA gyrase subunit A
MTDNNGIRTVDIDQQMRTAYLDYAMSVIVARALPDARDGLKPVHRRILFAMHELGIKPGSSYKKCARIVGEVLGKYHPHGDSSVYDALARMAQDFSLRYMLVDGQGNFGSIDGDPPAAMRYTEARLHSLASELLADIDKDTVDFGDNFDSTLREPLVLPSRLPNLLLNGSSGIAVGMATNIPPHNLKEVAAALNFLIENHERVDEISAEEIMHYLPGPDFPTGGIIAGRESILQAYSSGRSKLTVRGKVVMDENRSGKVTITITEIPFQVNKTSLIERIAELVRSGRLDAISDLRDESDRTGMAIVMELKRSAQPRQVLNLLYKLTPLQSTFGVQMLALVDGEPRLMPIKQMLLLFIQHRQVVIIRRTKFDLEKARQRAHILDGLLIALANLDAVIETIRNSPDAETARVRLIERFHLSEVQAQAILDMQLRRLAALERQKIEDEHRQILERIAYLEDLLANPQKILGLIQTETAELAEKYGDARRTELTVEAHEELKEEDLVADESVLISLTTRGYIKRTPVTAFRTLGRGRRGVSGQTMREEDEVLMLAPARTLQTVLFFSDKGKVYALKTYQIPEASRTDRGIPAINILALAQNERITAAVAVPDFRLAEYCTFATLKGKLKRVALSEFEAVRPSGLAAISLEDGDELGWVRLTSGEEELLLVTAGGYALRFDESQVRTMGRQAAGVTGLRMRPGDHVASLEVVEPGGYLLLVTEGGFGKRAELADYPHHARGGGGVRTADLKNITRTGKIAAARVVQAEDEVTLISASGVVLRLRVNEISVQGRAARGVRLMGVDQGDTVASVARLRAAVLMASPANGLVERQDDLLGQNEQEGSEDQNHKEDE